MVEEFDRARKVNLHYADLIEATNKGMQIPEELFVQESRISSFCEGCDHHLVNNQCEIYDSDSQAGHVIIENCNLATVNKKLGRMTMDGFIPWKK